MKHLKKFNESIKEDLEDICYELKDMGLDIRIGTSSIKYRIGFLEIKNGDKYIKWNNDIRDCLLRIKDYLGKDYIEFRIYTIKWYTMNLTEECEFSEFLRIEKLSISFNI